MLKVGPVSSLPPGEALRLDTEPPIAVFCTDDGELYAIDDTCTHQDASLADGWLEDCRVVGFDGASTVCVPVVAVFGRVA